MSPHYQKSLLPTNSSYHSRNLNLLFIWLLQHWKPSFLEAIPPTLAAILLIMEALTILGAHDSSLSYTISMLQHSSFPPITRFPDSFVVLNSLYFCPLIESQFPNSFVMLNSLYFCTHVSQSLSKITYIFLMILNCLHDLISSLHDLVSILFIDHCPYFIHSKLSVSMCSIHHSIFSSNC